MASDVSERLREAVAKRAGNRCEYCLLHEDDAGFRHQIDHILSRKHGGPSTMGNLAYACIVCNRFKGSDVASLDPSSGAIVRLFDPRRDHWVDHFQFDFPLIAPLTDTGRVTVSLLRMNAPERLAERRLLGPERFQVQM